VIRTRARILTAGVLALSACGEEIVDPPPPARVYAGGSAGTVFVDTDGAFSLPFPILKGDTERRFFRGRALFRDTWVIAPASTETRDGLGPVFNARSCFACHAGDGRGRPPEDGGALKEGVLRISIPGANAHGGPLADPSYGTQLQPLGVPGVPAEGQAVVRWEAVPGQLGDGTPYELRRPILELDALALGPTDPAILTSLRVAPMMQGLGLLESVDEATIVNMADPDDLDGDGISGRVNRVWDVKKGQPILGRFGWKANQPSIEQQTAGAFNGDLGITSSLFPATPCTEANTACMNAPDGGQPELLEVILDDVTFYARTLAVPTPRGADDAVVIRGEKLFGDLGCAGCHVPSLSTGSRGIVDGVADETIWPYSDLLLHDLGEGLADGRADFEAGPSEWRTPPLWGLGMLEKVNGHRYLLHDGRARGFEEAILWHGGEGSAAMEAYRRSSADDRAAVLAFLESL
jgi:CxxC motif-containing protein (DUF1111 family)